MALSVDLIKLFWTHSGLNTFNLHLVWILKNIFQEKRVLVICLIQTVVLLWCVVVYSFWFYEWFCIRYSFVDLRNFVVDWNIHGNSMLLQRWSYPCFYQEVIISEDLTFFALTTLFTSLFLFSHFLESKSIYNFLVWIPSLKWWYGITCQKRHTSNKLTSIILPAFERIFFIFFYFLFSPNKCISLMYLEFWLKIPTDPSVIL